MAELRTIAVGLLLSVIIISVLIGSAIVFQNSNDVSSSSSLANEPGFNSLNQSISSLINQQGGGTSTLLKDLNATTNSNSIISFGWVIWDGVVLFGKTMVSLPFNLYLGFMKSIAQQFGASIVIYLNVISMAVAITLLVLLYRFWRQGA